MLSFGKGHRKEEMRGLVGVVDGAGVDIHQDSSLSAPCFRACYVDFRQVQSIVKAEMMQNRFSRTVCYSVVPHSRGQTSLPKTLGWTILRDGVLHQDTNDLIPS